MVIITPPKYFSVKMTKKEIFNFIKEKISEQNGPSYDPYQGGHPVRFTSEVCRSPLGWMLPYKNADDITLKSILELDDECIDIIKLLDKLHDDLSDKYRGKIFIEKWNEALCELEIKSRYDE